MDILYKYLIDDPPMNERNVDLFIINLWGKFYIKRSTKKIKYLFFNKIIQCKVLIRKIDYCENIFDSQPFFNLI